MPCYICGRWGQPPLATLTWLSDSNDPDGWYDPPPPGAIIHRPSAPLWLFCDRWERQWGTGWICLCTLVCVRKWERAQSERAGSSRGCIANQARTAQPIPTHSTISKYLYTRIYFPLYILPHPDIIYFQSNGIIQGRAPKRNITFSQAKASKLKCIRGEFPWDAGYT